MTKIHAYFQAEKYESLVFIAIGTAAIVCGFYFWLVVNKNFFNGLGWPFLVIAIIQLIVGSYIYLRSPNDEKRVVTFAQKSPKNIKNIEIPRMEKVMIQFKIYRYIEISLLLIGLILFVFCTPSGFWKGLGLGLVIQAGIMFLADYFAENRGQHYLDYLRNSFG